MSGMVEAHVRHATGMKLWALAQEVGSLKEFLKIFLKKDLTNFKNLIMVKNIHNILLMEEKFHLYLVEVTEISSRHGGVMDHSNAIKK